MDGWIFILPTSLSVNSTNRAKRILAENAEGVGGEAEGTSTGAAVARSIPVRAAVALTEALRIPVEIPVTITTGR